jgi:hypothetical protein
MPRERSAQSRLTLRSPARLQARRDTGRRLAARRSKQSSGNPVASLRRGLPGRLASQPRSKRSRKGPALLGLLGALGAAGAAVLKRRQSAAEDRKSGYFPPPEPVGEAPLETQATPGSRST